MDVIILIRLSTFCCYSCVHRNTLGECECKNGKYVAERDFTCEDYTGKICGDCCFFEGNIDIDNEFKSVDVSDEVIRGDLQFFRFDKITDDLHIDPAVSPGAFVDINGIL